MYDNVFSPDNGNDSQEEVYEETTLPLLNSVFEGINATIFAYGAHPCYTHAWCFHRGHGGRPDVQREDVHDERADGTGESAG